MILGGVHGNEMTGIAVVKQLLSDFLDGARSIGRGSLILALGNLKAIERGRRGSVPHADMNRVFLKERLMNPESYEEFRASELAPFMATSDILIDIHSTNKPSKPFAVTKALDATRMALARCFPADEFLVSPPGIIDGTTDVWITENGGVGLGYESGMASDITKVEEVLASLDRVMVHMGMVEKALPERSGREIRVSEMREALVMPEKGFVFAEGRGEGSFEGFREGEVLGYSGSKEIKAPHDGLLMFPKLKEHQRPGKPVGFLAMEKKKTTQE